MAEILSETNYTIRKQIQSDMYLKTYYFDSVKKFLYWHLATFIYPCTNKTKHEILKSDDPSSVFFNRVIPKEMVKFNDDFVDILAEALYLKAIGSRMNLNSYVINKETYDKREIIPYVVFKMALEKAQKVLSREM